MSSDNSHTLSAHPQGYENTRGKERGRTNSVFFQGLIHIHCLFSLLWCLHEPLEGSGGGMSGMVPDRPLGISV